MTKGVTHTAPMKNLLVVTITIALMGVSILHAQGDRFVALSTVKSRSLAMGGATVSVLDDLGAIDTNPAAFELYQFPKERALTLFLNPTPPLTAAFRGGELDARTGSPVGDVAVGVGLGVKGAAFSARTFDVALLLGEEIPGFGVRQHDEQAFHLRNYLKDFSHSLVIRVQLASQVALGVSSSLFYSHVDGVKNWGIGLSYGLLIQPDPHFSVGLAYHDLPDYVASARLSFDRVVDEAINLGFSYRPFPGTLLCVDIRNMSEEKNLLTRELHVGLEQTFLSHCSVRCGYFRDKDERAHVYSAGVGLLNLNRLLASSRRLNHSDFALEYALLYRNSESQITRWHFLSLVIRI
jgi:hypothetical protein